MATDTKPATLEPALQPCLDGIRREMQHVSLCLAEVLERIIPRLFDPSFRIDILASESGVSAHWLQRHFQEELGCTVHEYVVSQRLVAARLLMGDRPQNLGTLATRVGFGSYDNLRAACERLVGQTPAEFLASSGKLLAERPGESSRLAGVNSVSRLTADAGGTRQALEAKAFDFLAPQLLADSADMVLVLALGQYRLDPLRLFRELLRESRDRCASDRPQGVKLATLALHALRAARPQLAGAAYRDLHVEGLTALANAQRLATDWQAADRTFTQAELFIEAHTVSQEVGARFFLNKGYLRLFQRRLAEARELLTKGYALAEVTRDCQLKAQLLCGRGYAQKLSSNIDDAIADYLAARAWLESDGQGESFLMLSVCTYLSNAEVLRENQPAATRWLQEAQRLCSRLGADQHRQRLRWLEGLVAKTTGRLSHAERCLRAARGALLDAGETGNAALISIDLAMVCLLRRKTDEAQRHCGEAIPLLSALELADEALSALRLFEQAVAGSCLSMAILRQLRTSLELHLEAPTLRS